MFGNHAASPLAAKRIGAHVRKRNTALFFPPESDIQLIPAETCWAWQRQPVSVTASTRSHVQEGLFHRSHYRGEWRWQIKKALKSKGGVVVWQTARLPASALHLSVLVSHFSLVVLLKSYSAESCNVSLFVYGPLSSSFINPTSSFPAPLFFFKTLLENRSVPGLHQQSARPCCSLTLSQGV